MARTIAQACGQSVKVRRQELFAPCLAVHGSYAIIRAVVHLPICKTIAANLARHWSLAIGHYPLLGIAGTLPDK